ncbi:hypothetical protein Cha6605_6330 (plasmid) [Chamaesiphon minutus PCC 6605]|uniref:Uncharacterized protein n=1 Tax=Chamaesiphon minutus (strain ATCC 27169 / PCC 6605) TaxID=1173020 RepID=K9UR43_CHAP6|nr:hypothetical protein Cha6605_6330 [Chamaesiphon minutus PCC 6605]
MGVLGCWVVFLNPLLPHSVTLLLRYSPTPLRPYPPTPLRPHSPPPYKPVFNFNKKNVFLTKGQLPYLVMLLAPIYLHGVDVSSLFKVTSNKPTILPITAQATIGDKAIKLEVAKNAIAQQTGLTHRPDIPSDRGMLYQTMTQQPLTFSGKGMEFATDLIFINKNRVVGLYTNVTPCTDKCTTYSLTQKYDAVMEVKAGIVEKLGIKNDTEIDLNYAGQN